MFRVVVIDDEPVIVRNIVRQIEKASPEFRVVQTANNGRDGMEIILSESPDLVFVDISMPVMNGIEMISALRERGNETAFIILSGYTEFNDAKKAIQLGVIDYLVKPINPLMFKEFLMKVYGMLMEKQYEHYSDILSEHLFYPKLLKDIEALKVNKEIQFNVVKCCVGAFQFYRNNNFASVCPNLSHDVIEGVAKALFPDPSIVWIFNNRFSNEFTLVIYHNEPEYYRLKIKQLYFRLSEILKLKNYLSIIYAKERTNIEGIHEKMVALDAGLYQHSIFAKSLFIELSQQKYLREQEVKEKEIRIKERMKLLDGLANYENKDAFIRIVFDILEQLKAGEATQALLINSIREIVGIINQGEHSLEEDILINECIANSVNYCQLESRIKELIDFQFVQQSKFYQVDNKTAMEHIKTYIEEHYSEKILIQDLANQYGFNYSYLCSLFKKYLNFSPNEYVIYIRIKTAQRLLVSMPKINIKEIASAVGYSDPYYFSRLFKSNTGLTPTEYKKKNRDDLL